MGNVRNVENGVIMREKKVEMWGIRMGMRGKGGGNAGNRGRNTGYRIEIEKREKNL